MQEALGKTSVAFCYPGEISSKLAASWLHVDTDLDTQSRWFILAGDGVYVTLYLVGEELFSCQTQMRAESLEQLLQSCTPDGSFFAFEDAQSRFDTLAPLSLLPGQTPAIHEASAANPCDARFSDALASSLGFNPYGDARYTDDAGNTTYTETGYALSISAAGELTLRSDGQVTRFRAASGEEADLVECARSLLSTMTAGASGDARLYLTGLQAGRRGDGLHVRLLFKRHSHLPLRRPRRGDPLLGRVHRAGEAPSAHVYAHDPDRLRSPARAGGGDFAGRQ